MNADAYLRSRLRTCHVLRAIAAGHRKLKTIRDAMPDARVADLRNSIVTLRRIGAISSLRQGGNGNEALYETTGPIEPYFEVLVPRSTAPDASELERAMGMPASVQATLAVAMRGRVIVGVAGLNARG
jgi:hypothetical protein